MAIIDCEEYVKNKTSHIEYLVANEHINAKLAIIANKYDEASKVYVKNKVLKCMECGINCEVIYVKGESNLEVINNYEDNIICCNRDKSITGIIVQLPLYIPQPNFLENYEKIRFNNVIKLIDPHKDVDGFNSNNTPCTPLGIMNLLKYCKVDLEGKNAVVIGRSDIVGKPMAKLLTNANATVTLCHSKTKDLSYYTKNADIIVVATGHRHTLTKDMISETKHPTIIDVGINRDDNGKLCGDCDTEDLKDIADITPVPKGVGIVTVATLVEQVVSLAKSLIK